MGSSTKFTKAERLTNQKLIDNLFAKKGKSIVKKPILFAFIPTTIPNSYPAQVLISVGKKKFKRATDRNQIRRRIKEAYRLNKHKLYSHLEDKNENIAIAILYLSNEACTFEEIQNQLNSAIDEYVKRF